MIVLVSPQHRSRHVGARPPLFYRPRILEIGRGRGLILPQQLESNVRCRAVWLAAAVAAWPVVMCFPINRKTALRSKSVTVFNPERDRPMQILIAALVSFAVLAPSLAQAVTYEGPPADFSPFATTRSGRFL
jgi:hypothetical protein